MISLDRILNEYGKKAVDLIKSKVPVVTGKTRDSVYYEVIKEEDKTTLLVKGRPYFKAVETGRGPFKGGTQRGLSKVLEEWLKAKGFQTKVGKTGIVYYKLGDKWITSIGLAKSMNLKGDYKSKNNIVEDVYSSELDRLIEELIKKIPQEFKTQIFK